MTENNAYITREVIESEENGLLDKYKVAVKDNISTKGIRTTCGSKMLENYIPPYNATVVNKILSEGGCINGKTNMDEFGMGTTTETSYFGATKNPIDDRLVPGGSSGGSAAAVANGDADIALGSDTGGSVRCPSAFCGIVGLKPTYGLVSRYGLISYGNSLEQIGPMAKNVEDVARLLQVISGNDSRDMTTSYERNIDYTDYVKRTLDKNVKVAIPEELTDELDKNVSNIFWNKISDMNDWVTYDKVSIKHLDLAVEAYYIIAMSEAASNLSRFDGLRYGYNDYDESKEWSEQIKNVRGDGFGDEVKSRIMLGTYISSEGYEDKYYSKAQKIRKYITSEFDKLFNEYDFICTPTMPVEPFRIGESLDDPVKMYQADANTTPVNLANVPAISLPINDEPIGIQIIAPSFEEERLIQFSSHIE